MKLATIHRGEGYAAARIEADHAVLLDHAHVGELLHQPDWETQAGAKGREVPLADLDYAPLVLRPEKFICVGLNYRQHILEMGRDLPAHPTLFAKFSRAQIGAFDDVRLPPESETVDWEAELGIVIGSTVRRVDREQARAAIAGYTVINDVTARDWQYRTTEWLQGKTFEATTPVGPWLVTEHAHDDVVSGTITAEVDGEIVQQSDIADLVFDPAQLVSYISTMITLVPGDVIASGTPGGVGHARTPPRYLQDGSVLVTRIEGIGELRNVCRREKP